MLIINENNALAYILGVPWSKLIHFEGLNYKDPQCNILVKYNPFYRTVMYLLWYPDYKKPDYPRWEADALRCSKPVADPAEKSDSGYCSVFSVDPLLNLYIQHSMIMS